MDVAVMDSSTALAWALPDEGLVEPAARLMRAFMREEIDLIAPSLWPYELAHGLRRAARRGRIDRSQAWSHLQRFVAMDLTLYPADDLIGKAWWLSASGKIAAYDACYLVLAKETGCVCITADRRLLNAAASTGLVRWIGDYT